MSLQTGHSERHTCPQGSCHDKAQPARSWINNRYSQKQEAVSYEGIRDPKIWQQISIVLKPYHYICFFAQKKSEFNYINWIFLSYLRLYN